jgi:hypothetical protein
MPNRRLDYVINVDSGGAVSSLNQVGRAGADAARDIEQGFDRAGSSSEQAIKALTATMDTLESDSAAAAKAVAAIGEHLTIDVDSSTVDRFVQDLKSKFGVAFDAVEADAKAFADVLERGVDMSRTTNEIKGVGDALDHTRESGDQSRSVLANLAGNAAQDLGQLGGVVGSLGVGIGQLAEYAVDGNISLSNLAKVAGPMLGLSAGLALVNNQAEKQAKAAEAAAQAINTYSDAIEDLGPSAEAAAQGLAKLTDEAAAPETTDLLTTIINTAESAGGALAGIFEIQPAEGFDVIALLGNMGYTIDQVSTAMAGGEDTWNAFMDTIERDPNLEQLSNQIGDVLTPQFEGYSTAVENAAGRQKFFNTAAHEAAAAVEEFAKAQKPIEDMPVTWAAAADAALALADGAQVSADVMLMLQELADAYGITVGEVLGRAKSHWETYATDVATATRGLADDAIENTTDALNKQAEAFNALADEQRAMIDAQAPLADAQLAWTRFFQDMPEGFAETSAAMADNLQGTDEWFEAQRAQQDMLADGIDLLTATRDAEREAIGVQTTATQRTHDQAEALGIMVEQLGDVDGATSSWLAQMLSIPAAKTTQFDAVLDHGSAQDVIDFVEENSGVYDQEYRAQLDQVAALILAGQVAALTAPRTIPATADLDTSQAYAEWAAFKLAVALTQLIARIRIELTGPGAAFAGGGGGGHVGASPVSAPSPTALAAPPATTSHAATAVATVPVTVAARPINVSITAGVIGGRYDVERAVVGALRDAERLGRI